MLVEKLWCNNSKHIEYYTVQELSAMLGISEFEIRREIEAKRLGVISRKNNFYVSAIKLNRWLGTDK